VLLLNTTEILPWHIWGRLWMLWPAILVLVGLDLLLAHSPYWIRVGLGILFVLVLLVAIVWLLWFVPPPEGRAPVQLRWPKEGVQRAEVELRMGVGRLVVRPAQNEGDLAQLYAQTDGWPPPEADVRWSDRVAYLTIRPSGSRWRWARWEHEAEWRLGLARDVPLRLRIEAGVSRSDLDLSELQVEELSLEGGVGEANLVLPARVPQGVVRIQGGVGAVHVVVPEGVAVQVHVRGGLGRVQIDTARFPQRGSTYRSKDYERAPYRLDIEIEGGVGEVTLH